MKKRTRINWKKAARNIPPRIRLSGTAVYEILYSSEFGSKDVMGETRFSPNQIVLKKELSPKNMVETYYHEVLHGISHEYNVGLTEEQVLNLERALPYIMDFTNTLRGDNNEEK